MISNIQTLLGLTISTLLILALFVFISKQTKQTNLKRTFTYVLICLFICCFGLVAQITLGSFLDLKLIYYDYFVYIGTCSLPVSFLIMTLSFVKPNIKITKKFLLLLIVPCICLLSLWTNDLHHMFYKEYSVWLSEGSYGIFFYLTSIYTYTLFAISLIFLIKYSIKNARFFLLQSFLIILGALIPIVVNVLGVLGFLNLSIYITPICFAVTILLFALSIFKFGFLKITPIALQTIVNKISDSYVIVDEDCIITDFNNTFLNTFSLSATDVRSVFLFDLITKKLNLDINTASLSAAIDKTKFNTTTISFEQHFQVIDKYFHIEINSINENDLFLGTLILLKDTTQHNLDMQAIKDNQDILVEKERLASLGQMIGGIAHNLKTPIMSISGATEGISDLVKEYLDSIGDPTVTPEDYQDIAKDMFEWISKIRTHLSYMSDIITAVKGQAVAFSDNTTNLFTIDELMKHVDILMKHELKNALITLNMHSDISPTQEVHGNINSLVQVVNNIISNAIQAYNGKSDEKIDLDISKKENNLLIKIRDYAGGLPENVKSKLFKEMITTKGKNGTGLGLFMSYSNIKAHFNGHLKYESINGDGTTFIIEIPI